MSKQNSLDKYFTKRNENFESTTSTKIPRIENENNIVQLDIVTSFVDHLSLLFEQIYKVENRFASLITNKITLENYSKNIKLLLVVTSSYKTFNCPPENRNCLPGEKKMDKTLVVYDL